MGKKNNKLSGTCGIITTFHTNIGAIMGVPSNVAFTLDGVYMKQLYDELDELNLELDKSKNKTDEEKAAAKKAVDDKVSQIHNITNSVYEINQLLHKGKPLTKELRAFSKDYANTLLSVKQEAYEEQKREDYVRDSGVLEANMDEAEIYEKFKEYFPSPNVRYELTGQFVAMVLQVLDREKEKYPDYTTEELILNYAASRGKGFMGIPEALAFICMNIVTSRYNKLKADGKRITAEDEELYKKLTNTEDRNPWIAIMYMTRHTLLDATKIKIGDRLSYIKEIEEGNDDNDFEDGDKVYNAEEESPEHWSVRADTISSFASLTAEARSILYQSFAIDSASGKQLKGFLGFPIVTDVMELHRNLMGLREAYLCHNSEEFMNVLRDTGDRAIAKAKKGNSWQKNLYNTLLKNPKKRTSFFLCYRKIHLEYSAYRRKYERGVTQFFRMESGVEGEVIYNNYAAEVLDIDEDNTTCIFNRDGTLNSTTYRRFVDAVLSDKQNINNTYSSKLEVYVGNPFNPSDISENSSSVRMNFIMAVNDYLNLHMGESAIDEIVNNHSNYIIFCKTLRNLATYLQRNVSEGRGVTAQTLFLGESSSEVNKLKRVFKPFLRTVIKNVDRYSSNSPVETAYRYNKSTFYNHTIPNYLGDKLEEIAKAASQGHAVYKKFLEDNYLCCPIFATKDGDKYIIHNLWLKKLYEEACDTSIQFDQDNETGSTENTRYPRLTNQDTFTWKFTHTITRGLGWEDREFRKFSEKDNYLLSIQEYFSLLASTQKMEHINNRNVVTDEGYAKVPLFITGDSNATRFMTVPVLSTDEAIDQLCETAFHEFERMKMFEEFKKWCNDKGYSLDDGCSGGLRLDSHRFSFFDSLNHLFSKEESDREKEAERLRDKNKLLALYDMYESARDTQSKENAKEALLSSIRKYVMQDIKEGYVKHCKELLKRNLITMDKAGSSGIPFCTLNSEEIYISGWRDTNGKSMQATKERGGNNEEMSKALFQFYLNTRVHLISQEQMLTVDPAFYMSTEDMQKRFKEVIAAGDCLDTKAVDPSNPNEFIDKRQGVQRAIYLTDIKEDIEKTDPGFFGLLKNLLDKAGKHLKLYHRASLTDGQAYRSFSSYRKILVMRGTWTEEMEAVYQIIETSRQRYKETHGGSIEGHRLDEKDLRRIHSYKVVFQPIKPFYYEFESIKLDSGDTMFLPVQLKYSECPIIPELLPLSEGNKASKLASLGYLLEDRDIDLAAFSTCVKVGGYGNIDIRGRNSYNDLKNAFEGKDNNGIPIPKTDESGKILRDKEGNPILKDQPVIHELPLKGYRIQSNIPEHFNSSRARGTQAIKHILGALFGNDEVKNYPFIQRLAEKVKEETGSYKLVLCKGTEDNPEVSIDLEHGISRKDLLRLAETLGSVGFLKSTMKLLNEFKDVKSISDALSAMVANDKRAPKNSLSHYKIGEDGKFRISPAEGVSAADNVASLMSKARKEIIKQRMNGGSAVQVSAYGFEDVLKCHVDSNNVIHSDCAVPFDFSYTVVDENGNETVVELDYFTYVDFNTGKLLDENNEPVEPGEGKSKLEKEFPGILDMLAYRIPTEKHYSMLSLKVKRFFPKTCGGIIMVPTQFTVIAGFDFDIDKLYFFRKEFRFNLHKPIEVPNSKNNFTLDDAKRNFAIWTSWYTETDKGKKIFPWLVIAAAQFYHDKEGVLSDDIYNLISIKEETEEVDGETQVRKVITVPSAENLQKIKDELKQWMKTDAKNFNDRIDYIDFYNSALLLMKENGIDTSEYLGTNAEEFASFIGSSSFRGKYCTPAYEWNGNKDIVDNSQTAVNNLLFELFKARLEDTDTLKERVTPGGCYNFTDALPFMHAIKYADEEALKNISTFEDIKELLDKGYGPAYNPTELSTIAHYQTYNAEYDDMIGVTANISINLRLLALYERLILKYPKESDEERYLRVGSMLNVPSSDHQTGRDFRERMLNGQDTEINTTECLNGSVDAVKAAVLEFFGINMKTLPMVTVLLKLGASPTDIGMLFNQPVVLEAMQKMNESSIFVSFEEALKSSLKNISLSSGSSQEELSQVMSDFRKNPKAREQFLTLDSLAYCFNPQHKKSSSFATTQYAVASFLLELNNVATEMSSQVSISKDTSTNSIQSTVGNLQVLEQKVVNFNSTFGKENSNFSAVVFRKEEVVEGPNGEEMTVEAAKTTVIDPDIRVSGKNSIRKLLSIFCDSPYCMEQAAYSSIMTFLDSVIGKCFPYRTKPFKTVSKILAFFTKRKVLDEDIFNAFNTNFMLYCLEHSVEEFNGNNGVDLYDTSINDTVHLNIPKRIFYNVFFVEYFRQVLAVNERKHKKDSKVPLYTDIPIIGAWHREKIKIKGSEISYLRMSSIGGHQGYQKDRLIDSWAQMLGSDDPVLVDMAYHLFWYSFYRSGFNISQGSCMHLTPIELKEMVAKGEYRNFFERVFSLATDEDLASEDNQQEGEGEPISMLPSYVYYSKSENHTDGDIRIPIKDFIKSFFMTTNFYQFRKELSFGDTKIFKDSANSSVDPDKNVIEIDATMLESDSMDDSTREFVEKIITPRMDVRDGNFEIVSYEAVPCIVTNDGDIYICDNDINTDDNISFNIFDAHGDKIRYYKMNKPDGSYDFSTPLAVVKGNKKLDIVNNDVYDVIDKATGIMEEQVPGQAFPKPGENENQIGGASSSFDSIDTLVNIAGELLRLLGKSGVEQENIGQIAQEIATLSAIGEHNSLIKRMFEVAQQFNVEQQFLNITGKYPDFASFMLSRSFRQIVLNSDIMNRVSDIIRKLIKQENNKTNKSTPSKDLLASLQTSIGLGNYQAALNEIETEFNLPSTFSSLNPDITEGLKKVKDILKEIIEGKQPVSLEKMADEAENEYNEQGTPLCGG